jgi:serine/threonine-protein phosphatase 2A activator
MNIRPTGPLIPQIPAVQGRRKFIKVSQEFVLPTKRITGTGTLEQFPQSEAYLRLLDFLQTLNESVKDKKLSDPCHESQVFLV